MRHEKVLGWLNPVPWHCSWKGVQWCSCYSFGKGFLLSSGYDYLLENWRIGESIFKYFASVNVKSLRIRIVMESSFQVLAQCDLIMKSHAT